MRILIAIVVATLAINQPANAFDFSKLFSPKKKIIIVSRKKSSSRNHAAVHKSSTFEVDRGWINR